MSEPPSPGYAVATAPASSAWQDPTPATARVSAVRLDSPAIRTLASYRLAALAGSSAAIRNARHSDTSHFVQGQILRPLCHG